MVTSRETSSDSTRSARSRPRINGLARFARLTCSRGAKARSACLRCVRVAVRVAGAARAAPRLDTRGVVMTPAAKMLDQLAAFTRRFVLLGDSELDAVFLWTARTYVFEGATATPYPVRTRRSRARERRRCFRMIDASRPTLLFDEVDAVLSKKNSDSTEGIRQVLNSGYRKGKVAWRCRSVLAERSSRRCGACSG